MIRMTREDFLLILDRQQKSGLSIKDFCQNEAYTDSSFYYWKSKFGLTGSKAIRSGVPDFAPVNILRSPHRVFPGDLSKAVGTTITIELPNGIKIQLQGDDNMATVSSLLTQICSLHVLSE